jgi:hypothetical protein
VLGRFRSFVSDFSGVFTIRPLPMNMFLVDFSVCPCGEQTAVRPSNLDPPSNDPRWSEREDELLAIACTKCNRVYRFGTADLVSQPTTKGIGPYNPEAPMTVFRVPIECDVVDCKAQLLVHVLLKSGTTGAGIKEATMRWNTSELFCLSGSGHMFQWPPFRH